MQTFRYKWRAAGVEHEMSLVPVPGTGGKPYLVGPRPHRLPVEVRDFHILSTPVTQALWTHVMGSNPAVGDAPRHPATNVSWTHITGAGGFLERINASGVLAEPASFDAEMRFRLPTETEWE